MKILHMSDLHFGFDKDETSKAIRNNYYDMLYTKLEEISQLEKVDLIIITGDIGWHARKDDYIEASRSIKRISKICNVDLVNIFICPGNHDVNRTWLDDKEFPINQKRANELLKVERLDIYEEGFASYCEFCNSMGLPKYTIGKKDNYLVGVISNKHINIICLNTAWYAKSADVKDKMWVGSNFIEVIKSDKTINNSNLTITILHHPPKSWHEHETSFYAGIKNTYHKITELSDMVLFGHTHEMKNIANYENKTFTCGAGALYEDSKYRNNFQIYYLDLQAKQVNKKIEFSFDNDEWIEKTWTNTNSQNSKLSFTVKNTEDKRPTTACSFLLSDTRIPKNLIIRDDLNVLFTDCLAETNVIIVEGIKGSGKDYFINSYFKNNINDYPNVNLYYASESETIDHFLINININNNPELSGLLKYIEFFDIIYENKMVLVIYGFSKMDTTSFSLFIKAATKYSKDIKIILVSDYYVDFGIDANLIKRFPIKQFTDTEVNDFLILKNIINFSDEMRKMLILKTEALPIALEAFCTLVTDLDNDPELLLSDTFANVSERLDAWFNYIVNSLDDITYKVLQVLSIYEKPFRTGLVKAIMYYFFPMEKEKQYIIYLSKTNLVYKMTPFRWKVHNLFADFCKRQIPDKEKLDIHRMLAEYCLHNSKTKFSKKNFNEELKWLEKACVHFQAANIFHQSEGILSGKFSKKLKQLGFYEIYLKLCEKEILKNSKRSNWLDYHYSHCALIIGKLNKAKKVLLQFVKSNFNISDLNLKLSLIRLYSEVLHEQGKIEDALYLLASEITKINYEQVHKSVYCQARHKECFLLLELGDACKAKIIIKNLRQKKAYQDNEYGLAIYHEIEATILEATKDFSQAITQHELALSKITNLGDLRGESWVKSRLGFCQFKHGSIDIGIQYICEAINIKRNINECSRDYLHLLNEVLTLDETNDEIIEIAKSEVLRIEEIMEI